MRLELESLLLQPLVLQLELRRQIAQLSVGIGELAILRIETPSGIRLHIAVSREHRVEHERNDDQRDRAGDDDDLEQAITTIRLGNPLVEERLLPTGDLREQAADVDHARLA